VRIQDGLLAVLVAAIWGLGFTFAKLGLAQFPPILLMALRFTLTALVLVWFVKPPLALMARLFVIALVSAAIQYSLTFNGLDRLDASTAVLVVQLEVPFGALLAAMFLGEKFGLRRALGLACAFAGVALIAGAPGGEQDYVGILLVVAGAFAWAVGQVMIKALGAPGGFTLIAWVAMFAAPQLFIASALFESNQIEIIRAADMTAWGVILYLGLIMTALGYGIWYHLLGKYQVNQVMPIILLLPVMSVIGSVLILGEQPTLAILAGGLIVIAGVAFVVFERRPARQAGAPPITLEAARALAHAFRERLDAGAGEDSALTASIAAYRSHHPTVPEDEARAFLAELLLRARGKA